ncbi:hypothetical protein NLG97_g7154 [Lecanicillium saksenae]|uniref:Uncharacterized protein n=1 Tax=Lecanicillium saksenae TaxID=468837 RepID=A0ACC1QN58_9HYPO|nr:hypothetical protein NLG97_g7154 [Lecanicillium saksenae]
MVIASMEEIALGSNYTREHHEYDKIDGNFPVWMENDAEHGDRRITSEDRNDALQNTQLLLGKPVLIKFWAAMTILPPLKLPHRRFFENMSLEFRINDLVTLIKLANRLRKQFVRAPKEFDCISQELRSLSIILQDVEVGLSEGEVDEQQKALLQDIVGGCHNALLDLEKDLGKYGDLEPDGCDTKKKMKRMWNRVKWNQNDIRDVRGRLVSNTALLSASLDRISSQTIISVKKGVERLVHNQDDGERLVILDWLTTVDYAPVQSDLMVRKEAGTGQWLLNAEEFQTWVSAEGENLFCPGIPGAGKTMLSAIVVDNLTRRFGSDENVAIAYIYCDYRRTQEQQAAHLLASLLKQIAERRRSLPFFVSSLYERHRGKRTRPSFNELSTTLQFAVARFQKVFIVVDALDECQAADGCRSTFLSEVLGLQNHWPVNFFATSRFIPSVLDIFRDSASLEIRAACEDVRKYVESRLPNLPSFVRGRLDLQEEVVGEITRAVDGMFLLAQLHINSLIGKRSPKTLRAALTKLPTGSDAYDKAYHDAMERIESQLDDQQNLAKEVLSWITCAIEPLSITELQHALAVEIGEHEFDHENIPHLEDIVSVCAGLVEVDKKSGIIRLMHYTTQEFFERTKQRWFPDAESHNTRVCITYLSYRVFANDFCQTDADFRRRLSSNPFYKYATQNWGYHARKASYIQEVDDFLRSFNLVQAASQTLRFVRHWNTLLYASRGSPQQVTGLHLAAHFGLDTAVESLLQHGIDADAKDSAGRTPLSWAARAGHESFVKILLMIDGVDINSQDYKARTPLSRAAKWGHQAVVKLLLAITDNVQTNSVKLASSVVDSGKTEKNKAIITLKDSKGRTPLHLASGTGHAEVVKLLLECRTPAGSVTAKDHAADEPDTMDICDTDLRTPLHYAALHSATDCVQLLLSRGAKITADVFNMTALHYTVSNSSEATAQCMLDAGVSISTGVKRRDYSRSDSEDEARSLLDAGFLARIDAMMGNFPASDSEDDPQCISGNSVDSVVDCRSHRGLTTLHYAALTRNRQMTNFFLNQGADPTVLSEYDETPLHLAIKRNCYSSHSYPDCWRAPIPTTGWKGANHPVVRGDISWQSYAESDDRLSVITLLLSKHSIDVNAQDVFGASPLHCVSYGQHRAVDITTALIKRGADVSAMNGKGETALHLACSGGDLSSVAALLDHGAEITDVNFNGCNAIHYAAQSQNAKLIKYVVALFPKGAVTSQDKYGRNALHCLVRNSQHVDKGAVECLVSAGVSVTELDQEGLSPLAVYLDTSMSFPPNEAEDTLLLLQHGSDASFRTPKERLTLAHLHAMRAPRVDLQVLQTLQDFGTDLKATDREGRTILHHCAIAGSLTEQAFQFLRNEVGLDKHLQDHHGKVAFQYPTEEDQE